MKGTARVFNDATIGKAQEVDLIEKSRQNMFYKNPGEKKQINKDPASSMTYAADMQTREKHSQIILPLTPTGLLFYLYPKM